MMCRNQCLAYSGKWYSSNIAMTFPIILGVMSLFLVCGPSQAEDGADDQSNRANVYHADDFPDIRVPLRIQTLPDEEREYNPPRSGDSGGACQREKIQLGQRSLCGLEASRCDTPFISEMFDQIQPDFLPLERVDLSGTVGIYSHYAGFVTNYPHNDGPSYDYYNSVNEKMPVWGMAAGGMYPGVENSVWIGGDFDSKYTSAPCGTSSDCYVPPPVDGLYRGWRTQGFGTGPCNCPTAMQQAYFSANRGIMMFDLSVIPDHATITGVQFQGIVSKEFGSGEVINFSQIEADRSLGYENVAGTGFKWSYDDAADGHLYGLNWNVAPFAVGNTATTALNASAVADIEAALTDNWFGLGLVSGAGETVFTSYYFGAFQGSGGIVPPLLLVDYHYCLPDAPMLKDQPPEETTADGETTCPVLTWDIPNEDDGNNLHFRVELSDTVPVIYNEYFSDTQNIDFSQTSYEGMITTSTHQVYDSYGSLLGVMPANVHLDELELTSGGVPYTYAKNYNVGWRYGRPFVYHLATDTWTGGGYSVDGLGDALMGYTYMEWSSDYTVEYPNTACATQLGYPASIIGVGGYIPSGIVESFWIALDYADDGEELYYNEVLVSNASSAFFVEFDPAIEDVVGVALFFTASNDGYAYMADLQIFDTEVYDPADTQTITSNVIATSSNPAHSIEWVSLYPTVEVPSGCSITWELSNDNGNNWFTVTPNTPFTFPTSGIQLRWRAHLSTTSSGLTPRIFDLLIYNLFDYFDSYNDGGYFEENATLAGTYQTFGPEGVPEYDGTTYQARLIPSAIIDASYYWKVRAFAPSGTEDLGASSEVWSFTKITDTIPPPDVGASLNATKIGDTVVYLDWSGYIPEPDLHYAVHRSENPGDMQTVIATSDTLNFTDDEATAAFLCYEIIAVDLCNNESID